MSPHDVWCPQCVAGVDEMCQRVSRTTRERQPEKGVVDPHQRRVDIADGYRLGWNAAVKAAALATRQLEVR